MSVGDMDMRIPAGTGPSPSVEPVPVSPLRASVPCAGAYGWWAGSSEEYMNIGGPFPTRDEAVRTGREWQGGDPFWIIEARLSEWFPPDASNVIDIIVDNSDELFYDDGFPGFDGGKEAEKAAEEDLQRVLNEWFQRHQGIFPAPTAFDGTANLEQIDASAIEAGTAMTAGHGAQHESAVATPDAPEAP